MRLSTRLRLPKLRVGDRVAITLKGARAREDIVYVGVVTMLTNDTIELGGRHSFRYDPEAKNTIVAMSVSKPGFE